MDKERIDKEEIYIFRTKCIVCKKSEMCISSITICSKCGDFCVWCDYKHTGPEMCSCVNFCNLTPEERAIKHKNHI